MELRLNLRAHVDTDAFQREYAEDMSDDTIRQHVTDDVREHLVGGTPYRSAVSAVAVSDGFTPLETQLIINALNRMPYMGLLMPNDHTIGSPSKLAEFLQAYGDNVRTEAARAVKQEEELGSIKRDLRAARRIVSLVMDDVA